MPYLGVIRQQWMVPALALCLLLFQVPAQADEFEDPWEDFNRRVHGFNMTADKYLLRPVTQGYRFITPDVLETGIRNVFSNVLEVPSALNALFQGKPKVAAHDSGRFLINSTVGLAGLFDVAKHAGLENGDHEDFGQTLAVWGFDRGPYLVLPFLGPSTVRDTMGLPVDWVTDPLYLVDYPRTRNVVFGFYFLNRRSQLMELEEHLRGDHYTFMRDAYLQNRDYLINDGEVEDSFGSDMDMSEYGGFDDEDEDIFGGDE